MMAMMPFRSIFWYLLLIFLIVIVSGKFSCIDSGSCISCDQEEMMQEYCKDTGKKMKTSCCDNSIEDYKREEFFRPCYASSDNDQLRVIIFQVVMAVVGGGAFYIVQIRKPNTMTLYENRRAHTTRR